MLTFVLVELVTTLAIHLSSNELMEMLRTLEEELRARGDVCAANYLARGRASHEARIASERARRGGPLSPFADTGGAR
jgi:hypothetical protein